MDTPKTMQVVALACPPELGCKTQLLKMSQTMVTGHGETKLVMTGKLPLCWLADSHSVGMSCAGCSSREGINRLTQ